MANFARRKILVASIGVATISYAVACTSQGVTSGNLPASWPQDAAADTAPPTTGNLPAPPEAGPYDAKADTATQDGALEDGALEDGASPDADADVDASADDASSGD